MLGSSIPNRALGPFDALAASISARIDSLFLDPTGKILMGYGAVDTTTLEGGNITLGLNAIQEGPNRFSVVVAPRGYNLGANAVVLGDEAENHGLKSNTIGNSPINKQNRTNMMGDGSIVGLIHETPDGLNDPPKIPSGANVIGKNNRIAGNNQNFLARGSTSYGDYNGGIGSSLFFGSRHVQISAVDSSTWLMTVSAHAIAAGDRVRIKNVLSGTPTVTVDPSANRFLVPENNLLADTEIVISAASIVPDPFTVGQHLFVKNPDSKGFQVALTSGGAAVDILTAGKSVRIDLPSPATPPTGAQTDKWYWWAPYDADHGWLCWDLPTQILSVDDANDRLYTAHSFADGTAGILLPAGSPTYPTGYTAFTRVYIVNGYIDPNDPTLSYIQIALTVGGAAIALSGSAANVFFAPLVNTTAVGTGVNILHRDVQNSFARGDGNIVYQDAALNLAFRGVTGVDNTVGDGNHVNLGAQRTKTTGRASVAVGGRYYEVAGDYSGLFTAWDGNLETDKFDAISTIGIGSRTPWTHALAQDNLIFVGEPKVHTPIFGDHGGASQSSLPGQANSFNIVAGTGHQVSAVDTGTGEYTFADNHGWSVGQAVVCYNISGGTAPTNFTFGTEIYVKSSSAANKAIFSASIVAPTAIIPGNSGSGTFGFKAKGKLEWRAKGTDGVAGSSAFASQRSMWDLATRGTLCIGPPANVSVAPSMPTTGFLVKGQNNDTIYWVPGVAVSGLTLV